MQYIPPQTFITTAVGFACQDGLLSTDDKVVSFFSPEELSEEISPWLAEMTVHDLLAMSSGFSLDIRKRIRKRTRKREPDLNWGRETLCSCLMFEPGTQFHYNSIDSYLVAVIVSEVVGEPMSEYLNHKFFKPLGINKWIWEKSPQGYDCGGWGQYCVIIPEKHAVVATLSHSPNGARMLNSVWTNVYDIL